MRCTVLRIHRPIRAAASGDAEERQEMPYQLEHRTMKIVTRGTHYPLGATMTPTGVNFALYSQHATEVFLLLFDNADGDPTDIIRLEERDKFVWHAHVNDIKAGNLRLQGSRPVPSGVGPSIQRRQTAPRSVRESRDGEVSQHRQSAARLRCATRCGRGGSGSSRQHCHRS